MAARPQHLGAYGLKKTMLHVYNEEPETQKHMALNVHDELVAGPVDTYEEAQVVAAGLERAMTKGFLSTFTEGIPLVVDVRIQERWQH